MLNKQILSFPFHIMLSHVRPCNLHVSDGFALNSSKTVVLYFSRYIKSEKSGSLSLKFNNGRFPHMIRWCGIKPNTMIFLCNFLQATLKIITSWKNIWSNEASSEKSAQFYQTFGGWYTFSNRKIQSSKYDSFECLNLLSQHYNSQNKWNSENYHLKLLNK